MSENQPLKLVSDAEAIRALAPKLEAIPRYTEKRDIETAEQSIDSIMGVGLVTKDLAVKAEALGILGSFMKIEPKQSDGSSAYVLKNRCVDAAEAIAITCQADEVKIAGINAISEALNTITASSDHHKKAALAVASIAIDGSKPVKDAAIESLGKYVNTTAEHLGYLGGNAYKEVQKDVATLISIVGTTS